MPRIDLTVPFAEKGWCQAACPHCQFDRLTSWSTREQVFKDLPMRGKPVGIYIDTKRLRSSLRQDLLTDTSRTTIVDMLHNRNKDTVAKYLFKMPNRGKVQYVAMDMWTPYRDAVSAVLPDTTIVIDKFHVVRMANDAMEKARKGLRAKILFTEGIHSRKQVRPTFERKRASEHVEMGRALPDDAMGLWIACAGKGTGNEAFKGG